MLLRIILWSVTGLLVWFFLVFGYSTYSYYQAIHADDPIQPFLMAESGMSKIIRGDLAIELTTGERYDLENNDAIETSVNARAIITWPDHSVTRLSENTRIVIHHMYANTNYDKIEISMSLKKGKIWTRVVRTMIGDSYFETKLPKNDIVAAVRGTTFEINLEKNYIHAVRHNINLSDGLFHRISLFPGEIVDSENILIKYTRATLDSTWNEINALADSVYDQKRLERVNQFLEEKKTGILLFWENFMRQLLGRFDGFQTLSIQSLIEKHNIEKLSEFSEQDLFRYYQRIQSGSGNIIPITTLRSSLSEKLKYDQRLKPYIEAIQRWAIWEAIDTNTYTIPTIQSLFDPSSREIIEKTLETMRTSLEKESWTASWLLELRRWLE